jgi:hypothetical protein
MRYPVLKDSSSHSFIRTNEPVFEDERDGPDVGMEEYHVMRGLVVTWIFEVRLAK